MERPTDQPQQGATPSVSEKTSSKPPVRHHLPQMAALTTSRLAISKASVKEYPSTVQPFANIVPMEEVEEPPLKFPTTDQNMNTPDRPEEDMATDAMPEEKIDNDNNLASCVSPASRKLDKPPTELSPTSPIKLKIRRSIQEGQSLLTSTVTLGEIGQVAGSSFDPESDEKSKGLAGIKRKTKTKALLKGQSRKKMGKKNKQTGEVGGVDGGTEKSGQNALAVTARSTVVKPHSQPVVPDAKWLVGDLVWAKVTGHPWWPCMVSFDPFTGQYVQCKGTVGAKPSYHVQFFGDAAERGWIAESSLLDYHGKEALEEYCKKMYAASKNKVLKKKFSPVNACRRHAWEIAIRSADEARPLSRQERKIQFTFDYKIPAKKLNEGRKLTEKSVKAPKNLKRKQRESEDEPQDVPPKKRRRKQSVNPQIPSQNEAQFVVFCRKRRMSVKGEHPEYTEKEIKGVLEEQWKQLSEEDQQKFIPMGSDVSKLGDVIGKGVKVSSGRLSRPTKKKLETDEILQLLASEISTSESEGEEKVVKRKKKKVVQEETSDPISEKVEENNAAKSKQGRLTPITIEERESGLEILKLSNAGPSKKEGICQICEKPGDLITCEGLCFVSFHLNCIGLSVQPAGPFKCDECVSGTHTCFICKERGKDTKRCSRPGCGKFYHDECIRKHPLTKFENNHFVCPLHTCITCAADHPKNLKATKGRYFRCVKCPTAFHVGDYCIAAGSQTLAGFNIICSDHFTPLKTKKHSGHLNVSWCFLCSSGGTLLCCERCPASFHPECLKIDFPEGAWNCKDCSQGKRPLYGDIVWVKVGAYRWWPGEICHPKNVPHNIQDMPHSVGEFPIRFFGSNDYYWITHSRVFLFQDGDKGTRETASSKNIDRKFHKAVQESVAAFRIWQKLKENREQIEMEKNDKKPPPYKHIKTNAPYGNVTVYKACLSEIPRCECNPSLQKTCSSDTECLNRMLQYECNPAVCPCGEQCGNQRFQRRKYPEVQVIKTESRGWALKTLTDIKKGQFVNEYCGELIDEEECKRRIQQAHDDNITNFYMLTLDSTRTIDAGPKGNLSRFMNHSCQPNCVTQKWNVNGDLRIGLFAVQDIAMGNELTFNYNLDCLGNEKTICRCNAPNCSGFLGVRPKSVAELCDKTAKDKLKKKKKKKKHKVAEHEDECYRCGEGGELVMCDKGKCTKSYHVQCLNLSKPPHGKWDCPWHHCDVCGKGAKKLCSECPNSFCNDHLDGNIFNTGDGKLVCSEHQELLDVIRDSRVSAITKVEPSDEKSSMTSDSSEDSETSPSQSDSELSAVVNMKDIESEVQPTDLVQHVDPLQNTDSVVLLKPKVEEPIVGPSEIIEPTLAPPAKKRRRSSKTMLKHSSSDSESVVSSEQAPSVQEMEEKILICSPGSTPQLEKKRGRPRKTPEQKKTPKSKKKIVEKERNQNKTPINQKTKSQEKQGSKVADVEKQNKAPERKKIKEPATENQNKRTSNVKKDASRGQKAGSSKRKSKGKTVKSTESTNANSEGSSFLDFNEKDDDDFADLVIDIPTF